MKISRRWTRKSRSRSWGFSLVEVVLALAVISFVFIGLVGLLGLGIANDQTSSEQTIANNIAASIVGDLRSTPASSSTGKSTRFGLPLPTTVSTSLTPMLGLTPSVLYFDNTETFISPINPGTVPANAAYVANVYLVCLLSTGAPFPQNNDMVRVVVSWPAQTKTVPAGSIDIISQFLVH